MKQLKSICYNANNSFNKDFNLKDITHIDKYFDFSIIELVSFLDKNYNKRLIQNIKTFTSMEIGSYRMEDVIDLEAQGLVNENPLEELKSIYFEMQNDLISYKKYREEMLYVLFNAKYKSTRHAVKLLINFYEKYLLYKDLFEEMYYEFDPSRKKLELTTTLHLLANKTLKFDFSQKLNFDSLSSGEINMATILYYLIFKTANGSIVLIDEPEVSLHMEWQKQFADIVKTIMKRQPGMQVIIASHSPFLTSGDESLFVGAELIEEDGE